MGEVLTPFAAAKADIARGALRMLADATAQFAGAAQPVAVIFERAAQRASLGGIGMVTVSPALTLLTSDVPGSPEGVAVTVDGGQYTVDLHERGDDGLSVLYLTKG